MKRWSTASAYLRPAMTRSNLIIATDAYATRVVMEGKRVVRVDYLQGGSLRQAEERREELSCAPERSTHLNCCFSRSWPAEALKALARWWSTCRGLVEIYKTI